MRQLYKWYARHVLRPWLEWRLRKPVRYRKYGIDMLIVPGAFHPGYFYSTDFLLQSVRTRINAAETVLELGCGSGLISLVLAADGAKVTAVDINRTAVEALKKNASDNQISLEVLESDLFTSLQGRHFDHILINPPYYPKDPVNEAEQAWFCGSGHEYYHRLFRSLNELGDENANILMVLSDGCDVEKISHLARTYDLALEESATTVIRWERLWVFRIIYL